MNRSENNDRLDDYTFLTYLAECGCKIIIGIIIYNLPLIWLNVVVNNYLIY
jgi:hypothetical protein